MLRTVTNVTGDAVVCGLVAHFCPIENMEDMATVMDAAKMDATLYSAQGSGSGEEVEGSANEESHD